MYGIYLNSLQHSLSFLQMPELSINTEIDGHYIIFIELGFLLRNIYQKGAMSLYNWLHMNSAISCDNDKLYNDLVQCVKENPPLYIAKSVIMSHFDEVIDSNDEKKILKLVQQLRDLDNFENWGIEIDDSIDDINDIIRIKNTLSVLKQTLLDTKYDKISEKKMNDINDLYVSLQLI